MGNYDFDSDLENAKQTEQEISDALTERYGIDVIGELNNTKSHDFEMIIPRKVSVEIKEDFMAEKTGNVAVEFSCRGKPSGIETTESDFYIYKIHGKNGTTHHLMETSKLRDIIDAKLFWKIVTGGDEGSDTMLYLFKLDIFIKYAWKLDI